MEIIKRANGVNDGETVRWTANEDDLRAEVNRRTYKAGYTDSDGQQMVRNIMSTVPCGEVRLNIWPRDREGNLIDD